MVSTVVEFEQDRRLAWQTLPPYPLVQKVAGGRIWRYELEPVEGGTLVRESWDISKEGVAHQADGADRPPSRPART